MEAQKINDEGEEELEGNSELFCDPCETDGKQLSAKGYCVNCDEYLCEDCFKVHLRPSVTRHHILKDEQNMPRKRPINAEMCQMHDEEAIEFYCKAHRALCCSVCKSTNHGTCKDMKCIADMLETIDIQQESNELKSKMKELVSDVDNTQYQVQTSLKAIAMNYDDAQFKVSCLQQKVDRHFVKLQNDIDVKLKVKRNIDFEKINSHRVKCDAMLFDINTLENLSCKNIAAKHKYKEFLAMKRAENKIMSNHDELKRIRQNSTVQRYKFEGDTEVTKLLSELNSYGDIHQYSSSLKKTVQYVGNVDINAEEDTQKCHITGLTLMSEKYLVVADNNNMSIKLINTEENKIVSQKVMETSPWDITSTNDRKIAITMPSSEKIQFLRVQENNSLESVKELRVGKKCYGIEYIATENKIIMSSCHPGKVEIIDMDGHTLRLFDLNLNLPYYVKWIPSERQIVISDVRLNKENEFLDGCVRYVSFDGSDANVEVYVDMLNTSRIQPLGLTTDHVKGIYVCDHRRKVYFIDYDQKKTKHIGDFEVGQGNASVAVLQTAPTGLGGFSLGVGTNVSKPNVCRKEEHPDALIDFTMRGISPRCTTYCKKTFTLYVGEMGNKIPMYVVA